MVTGSGFDIIQTAIMKVQGGNWSASEVPVHFPYLHLSQCTDASLTVIILDFLTLSPKCCFFSHVFPLSQYHHSSIPPLLMNPNSSFDSFKLC